MRMRRARAIVGVSVTTPVITALALFSLWSNSPPSRSPHFLLTSGSNFSITSTIYTTPSSPYPASSCSGAPALLYPGVVRCVVFSVHNSLKATISIKSIRTTLDPAFPASPASCNGPNLSLPSFSGSFDVASGVTVSSPGVPMALKDSGNNQDICKGVTLHFVYAGTATYTEVYNTSAALASSANPSVVGQAVAYSATVTAAPTASQDPLPNSPTGTVTFKDNSTTICNAVPVTSTSTTTSTATCSPPAYLTAGTHPIMAVYSNSDGNFSGSTSSTLTQVVKPSATTTGLTNAPNPSSYGQPVTLSATVTASSGPTPAGSVSFYLGTPSANHTLLGTATLNAFGKASIVTATLPGGSDSLYAIYAGSPNDTGSPSVVVTQTVGFSSCMTTKVVGIVTVPSGQDICIRSTGSVGGSVTVNRGGRLDILGGSVSGNVIVLSGGAINVQTGSIAGNLSASNPTFFTVCGAKIFANLSAIGSTAFALVGDAGDDGSPVCSGSTISGNLVLSNNTAGAEVGGNTVSGGISLTGTTGTGPSTENAVPEVEKNTVNGGLSCSSNTPAPKNDGLPNKVTGVRSGQCSAAGF